MYQHLRPLLFRLDPESAHRLTLGLLRMGGVTPAREMLHAMFAVDDERLRVQAFELEFRNPVGLAAGYDKNGVAVRGLAALGFGHLELGTVTPLPQIGNDKPRVWRAPEATALVNRMGFPNDGGNAFKLTAAEARIGVNIGKGKDTPIENAAEDYIALLSQVANLSSPANASSPTSSSSDESAPAGGQGGKNHARPDYIAINVSSPNTTGLRALQAREHIEPLLRRIADARDDLNLRLPLLVKIAPDLSFDEIDGIVDAARDAAFDGIIATNTTVSREGAPEYAQLLAGGMSGAPLRARSTEIVRHICEYTRGEFPIIGVGGITDAESALEKLRAGATLIQIFTGLVYRGPRLVQDINRALLRGRQFGQDLTG